MTRKLVVLPLAALTVILCWMAFWTGTSNRADLVLAQDSGKAAERRTIIIKRDPVRVIPAKSRYPTLQGLAIDEERGELFVTNNNREAYRTAGVGRSDRADTRSINVYRVEFSPTMSDRVAEPIRTISGPLANLGNICSVAVSPEFKEIYKVSLEGNSELGVYPLDANGDVEALRWLPTSHGAWGLFLERKFDELFVTIEHVNRIEVYRRTAQLTDDPVRYIQGPKTELASPHGIYVDAERNEIYVANHGHWRHTEPGETYLQDGSVPPELRGKRKTYLDLIRPLSPSTGKFLPPSITVYSRTATWDVAPLRVIQGSKTGLNLPLGIFLDTVSHQLVVANGGDDKLLFFDANASGDVAPVRVLSGPATELADPISVVIDRKRNELWVTNWGNHAATVYPRTAMGNVAPLRVIRSGPKGIPRSSVSGGGLAYNPKRKEFLIPN